MYSQWILEELALKNRCWTNLLLFLPLSGCGGCATKETPREIREFTEGATELKLDMGSAGESLEQNPAKSNSSESNSSQESKSAQPEAPGRSDEASPTCGGESS
ncbi:MAG: hypothetical protein FJ295_20385 [Planctomycetes bacterium]|nr:hypothetical protein [Planctomycetota bacterium]